MATSARLAEFDLPDKKAEYYDATLASGTVTINTGFKEVLFVTITQKAAVGLAVGIAWVATGGAVTLDSSNAAGTEVLQVKIEGKR